MKCTTPHFFLSFFPLFKSIEYFTHNWGDSSGMGASIAARSTWGETGYERRTKRPPVAYVCKLRASCAVPAEHSLDKLVLLAVSFNRLDIYRGEKKKKHTIPSPFCFLSVHTPIDLSQYPSIRLSVCPSPSPSPLEGCWIRRPSPVKERMRERGRVRKS